MAPLVLIGAWTSYLFLLFQYILWPLLLTSCVQFSTYWPQFSWLQGLSLCFLYAQMYCCCLVAKSCPTLCEPKDCSLPGSSVHGISQTRILEWVAISSSSRSSRPRNRTCISCIGRWVFHHWATWEAPQMYYDALNFNLSPCTIQPLLETRFSDSTPEFVNESVGAGPWARRHKGLWSLSQVTPPTLPGFINATSLLSTWRPQ